MAVFKQPFPSKKFANKEIRQRNLLVLAFLPRVQNKPGK
jgi:hypothetical protein